MKEKFDVIVIGMGPGGEEVAEQLAEAGLAVAGVEMNLVGGECPYWGCIPSKAIIRAADALAEGRRIPELAGSATITPDWAPVARRLRDQITDNWDDRVAVERFERKGGNFFRGRGRLAGPGKVQVGDTVLEASRAVVINTGTSPAIPPIPGLDGVQYWTNREAIEAEQLPESLLVMGGGAIGAELAQAFARFGVRVTVVEAADRILALEEPEAGEVLAGVFEREGIEVLTSARVESAATGEGVTRLTLAGGKTVEAERLLVATGRRPNLRDLGLETVGLDPGQHFLPVDDHLRAAPGVWGVGDITGKGAFTHVSVYQARIAIADILGRPAPAADYRALPRVTFTDPEVGAVGLTEAEARKKGIQVRSGSSPLSYSTRGFIHGPGNDGFIKLVEDAERGVLVGGSTAGPSGGEMISMLCVAVAMEVPTERLRHMIWAYPTFHRGIEGALQALARPAMEPVG
ncbi:MAG: pyridine nucleotide-disulfide oxidoreductase [Candidatus Nephthysia bennettiae]|uniref:NAD(P)/FAD-dependent oxidoreductase n=1 Tax=Candidatus Nephthysia bennettiae TaxID=3127016 RepID=A0A934KCJ1_9BACT|nr:NAD(P)/FAD-dependent oxidoreductase [Candidatus Dormibacteraeota bacterium]MBJ7611439.1 NAD(P)/FAD-dependent oxidoreductase [Candidatus Dormibacteraeota bacterium]PZR87647.1 MAG: pyridine nucleotide-disulfide oxidoreductase [Candidatus Dormibacteraeota bacterium]